MDGWVAGWMDGWMDISVIHSCIHVLVHSCILYAMPHCASGVLKFPRLAPAVVQHRAARWRQASELSRHSSLRLSQDIQEQPSACRGQTCTATRCSSAKVAAWHHDPETRGVGASTSG